MEEQQRQLKNGFYTALGTPLNSEGGLEKESFLKHAEDQIEAGAAGLLVMGTMGIEAYITNSVYPDVARAGAEAGKGRLPVLVGVMDTSISRVRDRIDALKGMKIDGVVATTPYYFTLNDKEIYNFYSRLARECVYPLYLYDLPAITKTKITWQTAERLMKEVPNCRGIKSGDLTLARNLSRSSHYRNDFAVVYSGVDTFDVAYRYGITKNLDGIFSCTPRLVKKMYQALPDGDWETAGDALEGIIRIRDGLVGLGIFPAFTEAMNLLGCKGRFHPDYAEEISYEAKKRVKAILKEEGELD
jgi:4-hydroxy-tetrahydrodipicolinate synthase